MEAITDAFVLACLERWTDVSRDDVLTLVNAELEAGVPLADSFDFPEAHAYTKAFASARVDPVTAVLVEIANTAGFCPRSMRTTPGVAHLPDWRTLGEEFEILDLTTQREKLETLVRLPVLLLDKDLWRQAHGDVMLHEAILVFCREVTLLQGSLLLLHEESLFRPPSG